MEIYHIIILNPEDGSTKKIWQCGRQELIEHLETMDESPEPTQICGGIYPDSDEEVHAGGGNA
jgi:hypothetical protein